ncbi:MAG: hypothetical protein ACRD21_11955, partial [Vicinamibacteria bacterium]
MIGAVGLLLASAALSLPQPSTENDTLKRVLILHSFSADYFPDLNRELKRGLASYRPEPVELVDVPLEVARTSDSRLEGPFVEYIRALIADRRLDLVIAVAVPAARFWLRHREALFPEAPLVLAAVENRVIRDIPLGRSAALVPVAIDLTAGVENILRIAPATREIFVVLG